MHSSHFYLMYMSRPTDRPIEIKPTDNRDKRAVSFSIEMHFTITSKMHKRQDNIASDTLNL